MKKKLITALNALDGFLTGYRFVLGLLFAALLSSAVAVYNISSGPLSNLNDIGGWNNRLLFIAMTAAVHALVLALCAALHRGRFSRLALRQLILTAGMIILLTAINQKTYAYVKGIQPLIRAMDTQGLAAAAGFETNLSAPAMTLLYLITRGPVYDMYLVKLACIGCLLTLALLCALAAERAGLGARTEALLTLCVILPQGFMNAACSAQTEIIALLLIGVSLALCFGAKPLCGALCFGAAAAVNGVCLYALPVYLYLMYEKKMRVQHLGAALLAMLALCVPAIMFGMPAGEAFASLLRVNLGTPAYASGAPNVMSMIARPLMEETPQYAQMLRHLPELDAVANAQQDYTAAHYVWLTRGVTLAGLAGYLGICAFVIKSGKSGLERALILVLSVLLVCPGAASGAWLAADMLCLWVILARPALRLPACMVLFATAGASCYPMTEETVLPMAAAAILCLLALCLMTDMIALHAAKEEDGHG